MVLVVSHITAGLIILEQGISSSILDWVNACQGFLELNVGIWEAV
jgi:hypothetical protein